MSAMWLEEMDTEAADLFGGDESAEDFEYVGDDAEGFDLESYGDDSEAISPATRRRRAREQRARLVRNRKLQRLRAARARSRRPRPPGSRSPGAIVRSTRAAVEKVDLENKVQADAITSALAAQAKRAQAGENAAIASAIVSPLQSFLKSFMGDIADNRYFKAGLPLAPLLLLKPAKKGQGTEALLSDKRVWAVGAVVGLTFAEQRKATSGRVAGLLISDSDDEVAVGRTRKFRAEAFDSKGNPIRNVTIKWRSDSPGIVDIDEFGVVDATAVGKGKVFAELEVDGTTLSDSVPVEVV